MRTTYKLAGTEFHIVNPSQMEDFYDIVTTRIYAKAGKDGETCSYGEKSGRWRKRKRWSLPEAAIFECGIAMHGYDLEALSELLPHKTKQHITVFYNIWAETARCQKWRLICLAIGMSIPETTEDVERKRWNDNSMEGHRAGLSAYGFSPAQEVVRKEAGYFPSRNTRLLNHDIPGFAMSIKGAKIDKDELLRVVEVYGGIERVRQMRLWQSVRRRLDLPYSTSSGTQLSRAYDWYTQGKRPDNTRDKKKRRID